MPGLLSAGIQAKGEQQELDAAKDQFARVEKEREQGLALGNKLDWTPEQVSKALGSYQRSQSPVADAFIGSFLSGTNDQAIQSTRAGAPRAQAAARQQFDQQYGGWDKLRQQDAEMRKSQPWTIKDIAEVTKVPEDDLTGSAIPYLGKDQVSALKEQGLNFKDGKPDSKTQNQIDFFTDGLDFSARDGQGQQFLQALSTYLQQGGSWKDLTMGQSQKKGKIQKIDVDSFIEQYRPKGSASLVKPGPAPVPAQGK